MPAHVEKALRGLVLAKVQVRNAAHEALIYGAEAALKHAKKTPLFHDRTGETRASIVRRGTFVIAGGAAKFLQYGTPPHRIEAHGRALRFVAGGAVLFRKWVNHPGTKPRPFMTDARAIGLEFARLYVKEALSQKRKARAR